MKRIVVGFDGSEDSAAALAWAVEEARLHDAGLEVATVLGGPGEKAVVAALHDAAAMIVHGYPFKHEMRHGSPPAELSRCSEDAGLLVVGSRGRSAVAGLVLGSVSRSILHDVHCPVAVLPPDAWPPGAWPPKRRGRIAVGVDGSPDARAALALADREAQLRHADLVPVHAVYWDPLGVEWVEPAPTSGHPLSTVTQPTCSSDPASRPIFWSSAHGDAASWPARSLARSPIIALATRSARSL